MANDERFVDRPSEFQLERYLKESRNVRRGTDKACIDSEVSSIFGYGPRMCPGANIADVIILTFLATTLEHYKIELAEENANQEFISKIHIFLINRPDPIPRFSFRRL